MTSSNNPDSYGKMGSRKKIVDLKAVAALLDEDQENSSNVLSLSMEKITFTPNEELIQETARIRSGRDLIQARMAKMEENRSKVSKNVYEKVKRDYLLQMESINRLLSDKKQVLDKELKRLYLFREKLTMEMARHREILEEAQFRHLLEEFTEEQFKEVEEFESREIGDLQNELAQINSYIKLHEELFDLPSEVTKTVASPLQAAPVRSETPPPQPKVEAPSAPAPAVSAKAEFVDQTPLPEKAPSDDLPPLSIEPEAEAAPLPLPQKNYFESTDSNKPVGIETGKTIIREPESIYDILKDVPEVSEIASASEISETHSRVASSLTPLPSEDKPAPQPVEQPTAKKVEQKIVIGTSPVVQQSAGGYKLIFTQLEPGTEMDSHEFTLKDNVSIGRSPSNDLVLKTPKVSRQHAAINKYKDQYLIIDLKSSNGVFINGRKVEEHALQEGDEVSIAGYKMKFTKV